MQEKKVQFTDKRVDESWKETISKEKGESPSRKPESSPVSFAGFITSVGLQAMMRMGMLKPPAGEEVEVDLDAARETIDLLVLLREKTRGNLTQEEETLLNTLIADLQVKFVEHKTP